MDTWQAIQSRRSVRSFKAEPLSEDLLKKLVLDAAVWAPSGGNAQTWRFIIVNDPEIMNKIKMVSPGLLGNPPAVIAICQDLKEAKRKGNDLGEKMLTVMDTSMAAQNIMLAAHAEGLGTCAIASFHPAATQQILGLPEHITPQLLISIGVPRTNPVAPKRNTEVLWINEYH